MIRRGFTLVELSAVIVLLALMAAAVMPRLSATLLSSERRQFRQGSLSLLREAREQAIRTGQTTTVAWGEQGFELQTTNADDESATQSRVRSADGVTVGDFELAGRTVGDTEWELSFSPDGTTEGGAFTFTEGNSVEAVRVLRSGRVLNESGSLEELPDPEESWPAGEVEQRG